MINSFIYPEIKKEDREFGGTRSPEWGRVRKEHLKKFPECALTNSKIELEVHHIKPVHLFPELELDFNNLITLRRDVHLLFAHLNDFHHYNLNLLADINIWREKIQNS